MKNSEFTGENRPIQFRGIKGVDATKAGRDIMYLDVVYIDLPTGKFRHFRKFDPGESVRLRVSLAEFFSPLMEALSLDWEDVPHCYGWPDFISAMRTFTEPAIGRGLYAKVILNESGYPDPGEGQCFSSEPNMTYSEGDTRFMTLATPGVEHDLPF